MTLRSLDVILLVASSLVSVPIGVLLVECLASLIRRHSPGGAPPPLRKGRVVVLIPAHNEESVIVQTLESIRPQLSDTDRLIVIADNCTDQTAARARQAGATVHERSDPDRRGKVAALAFGLSRLVSEPAEVLVLVDADTRMEPGSIVALAHQALETGRPMQAVYLLSAPEGAGLKTRFSSLAFAIKNFVRPRGLVRLGLPCPLVGTGMAIPWGLLERAHFSERSIVEDLQLGIDLAIAGFPAALCEDATVSGYLPSTDSAAKVQRRRWEHGHLRTIGTQVPRLIGWSIRKGKARLLAMALDLAVPPLSLLGVLWMIVAGASALAALRGWSRIPAVVSGVSGLLFGLAILVAWGAHLRKQISFLTLLFIPLYVFWKIPLYIGFLFVREKRWLRTPREESNPSVGPVKPPS
jgi:cellulose synthase/poly-beta-1,6-N-acetylglucosamine synthase-like glycosyltransferase